jgi:hypothetical protein
VQLGAILGPIMETKLREALTISGGDLKIPDIFSHPRNYRRLKSTERPLKSWRS